jgi:Ca2+-binding EF-hand superfamily protein
MLTRSEARARLFGMKRRIVDRLLQKKASETGNKERQDTRLLILAYRDMDENGDGSIDYEEFHKALGPEGMNCGLAPPEISDLFTALDMDGSGDVSMQEFLDELMIADNHPRN